MSTLTVTAFSLFSEYQTLCTLFDDHCSQVMQLALWTGLEQEIQSTLIPKLDQETMTLILRQASTLLPSKYSALQNIEGSPVSYILRLLLNKKSVKGLLEVLRWYDQALLYFDPNSDIPCPSGDQVLFLSLTSGDMPLGMVLIVYTPEMRRSITNRCYATMIGITSSVPYFLARALAKIGQESEGHTPSPLHTLLVPEVLKLCKQLGAEELLVNPLPVMGKILSEQYGFEMIVQGNEREEYLHINGYRGSKWSDTLQLPTYRKELV